MVLDLASFLGVHAVMSTLLIGSIELDDGSVGSTHRRKEGGATFGVTPKKQDEASTEGGQREKRKDKENRTKNIVKRAEAQEQVT